MHSIVCEQPPPPLSFHVAVLLVVCIKVTLGSEAGPLTGRGLHTGDTHTVTLMGFTCQLSPLCVFVCVSESLTCVKVGVGVGESKGQRLGVKSRQWWHKPRWQVVLDISLAQYRGEEVAAG